MHAAQLHLLAEVDDDEHRDEKTARVPVLYRCHACERIDRARQLWRSTYTRRTAGRLITWTTMDGRTLQAEQPPAESCPRCKRQTPGTPIRGTFSGRPCDARCLYAKGPDCECSCGGANHGAGHVR